MRRTSSAALLIAIAAGGSAQAQLRMPQTAIAKAAIRPALPVSILRQKPGGREDRQILRETVAASQATLRAALAGPAGCEGCIAVVNGKPVDRVTFTPGTEEMAAAYVISGAGFGDTPGSVYLRGGFNTRPELRVDGWSDRRIVAYFPRGLRGEVDQGGVGLVVRLPDGRLIETPATARFVAAREEQVIGFDDIPRASVRSQSDTALTMKQQDGGLYFFGVDSGESVKHGYTDRIVLNFLKPGFEGVAASTGFCRTDTGDTDQTGGAGGRYVYGQYDLRWDGDDIVIDRAMWQSHSSPMMAISATNSFESCFRDLKVTVAGPAGIRPLK